MFRFAEIRVRLLESTEDGAIEHIHALSQRYLGKPYELGSQIRYILKTEPVHINARI